MKNLFNRTVAMALSVVLLTGQVPSIGASPGSQGPKNPFWATEALSQPDPWTGPIFRTQAYRTVHWTPSPLAGGALSDASWIRGFQISGGWAIVTFLALFIVDHIVVPAFLPINIPILWNVAVLAGPIHMAAHLGALKWLRLQGNRLIRADRLRRLRLDGRSWHLRREPKLGTLFGFRMIHRARAKGYFHTTWRVLQVNLSLSVLLDERRHPIWRQVALTTLRVLTTAGHESAHSLGILGEGTVFNLVESFPATAGSIIFSGIFVVLDMAWWWTVTAGLAGMFVIPWIVSEILTLAASSIDLRASLFRFTIWQLRFRNRGGIPVARLSDILERFNQDLELEKFIRNPPTYGWRRWVRRLLTRDPITIAGGLKRKGSLQELLRDAILSVADLKTFRLTLDALRRGRREGYNVFMNISGHEPLRAEAEYNWDFRVNFDPADNTWCVEVWRIRAPAYHGISHQAWHRDRRLGSAQVYFNPVEGTLTFKDLSEDAAKTDLYTALFSRIKAYLPTQMDVSFPARFAYEGVLQALRAAGFSTLKSFETEGGEMWVVALPDHGQTTPAVLAGISRSMVNWWNDHPWETAEFLESLNQESLARYLENKKKEFPGGKPDIDHPVLQTEIQFFNFYQKWRAEKPPRQLRIEISRLLRLDLLNAAGLNTFQNRLVVREKELLTANAVLDEFHRFLQSYTQTERPVSDPGDAGNELQILQDYWQNELMRHHRFPPELINLWIGEGAADRFDRVRAIVDVHLDQVRREPHMLPRLVGLFFDMKVGSDFQKVLHNIIELNLIPAVENHTASTWRKAMAEVMRQRRRLLVASKDLMGGFDVDNRVLDFLFELIQNLPLTAEQTRYPPTSGVRYWAARAA